MQNIKTLIQSKFNTLALVTVAVIFSIFTLMLRIKLNQSFFYLFLVWNVFLAIIPYAITMYLNTKTNLNRFVLIFWFLIWLAFLPNAPYIVTDFIHLTYGNGKLFWLDIIVLLSFALTGLLLFYLSILDMQKLLIKTFKFVPVNALTLSILFLCGFGVYLGRFLRYNSWEIISNPKILITDILEIIIAPFHHSNAWLFTIGFGGFLVVGHWVFTTIYNGK